jgi:fucose permease
VPARLRRLLYLQLGIAFFAFIFIGANDGAGGVLLPSFQRHYDLDKSGVSVLFFGGTCGYLLAAFLSGLMRERLGLRAFQTLGGGCLLVGMAVMVLMPPWYGVLLTFVLLGFGVAIIDAGLNAYIAELPDNSALLNYLHAFYGAGALLGPLLASSILALDGGWNLVYATFAGLAVVLVTGLAGGFRTSLTPPSSATATADKNPDRNVLAAALRLPLVWIGAIFLLFYVGAEVCLGVWAYSYLTEQRGLAELLSGWLVSGYWLGLTLGRVVLGRATRRFGNLLVIQLCLGGTAAGVLLLWLGPGAPGAALGLLLAGFSLGPIFPTMIAVQSAVVPPRLLPSAIGFMASLGAGGAALFPWVAGNLAEALGLWAILPYVIALTAVILGLWLLFQWRLPRAEQPAPQLGE